MKLNSHNVTIMVNNMDEAIVFYEAIGLKLDQRWENHYAMMSGGGITLGIHPADGKQNLGSGTVSIGFMVDDIGQAKAMLQKQGISFNEENDGKSGQYLHFKDPAGSILYFVKPQW